MSVTMSGHAQRSKLKAVQRSRNQRLPIPPAMSERGPQNQINSAHPEDMSGIFSNPELTYVVGRHIIGNICELTTTENDVIFGLIKAVSPSADVGLTYANLLQKSGKNGRSSVADRVVPLNNIKMVHIRNVNLMDCLMDELKTDTEIANKEPNNCADPPKKLIPFFNASESLQDCILEQGGFPADEMFRTNEKLFSVPTTYNPDLREYTTPVERNAPNYQELEARCAKLAQEIEADKNSHSTLEEKCEKAIEDEEEKYSAVLRTNVKDNVSVTSARKAVRHSSQNEKSNISRQSNPKQVSFIPSHDGKLLPSHKQLVAVNDKPQSDVPAAAKAEVVSATTAEESIVPSELSSASCKSNQTTNETNEIALDERTPVPVEIKIKKSTLDPNAPEFQPMAMQYGVVSCQAISPSHSQPSALQIIQQSLNALGSSQNAPLPAQPIPTFVATSQPQFFAAPNQPYGSQGAQVPHVIGNTVSAAAQQMRGGSLPPSLQQQSFAPGINPGAGVFLHAQPGIPQLVNSPVLFAGAYPTTRYSGPVSNSTLTRPRSNEAFATQHSSYSHTQNTSMPTFQSPALYQIPQPNGPPLIVYGNPPVGYQMLQSAVPGAAGNPAIMMGNVGIPQTSNHQVYPAHSMVQIPSNQMHITTAPVDHAPTLSSAQQQHQHTQQHLPPQFGNLPDISQMQFSAHPQSMVLAAQSANPGYYAAAPTVLNGQGATNPSVQPGLLPMVGQLTTQSMGSTVAHHPPQMDATITNAQQAQHFSQNHQSQCVPQFPFSQFFQAQNMAALAALVGNGMNQWY